MNLRGDWLVHGYFDLGSKDHPRGTVTQQIRDRLAGRLGGPVEIHGYPSRQGAWRYAFYWREGDREYAEAQFFAQVADDYPMLAVGLSVEKGLEDVACAPVKERDKFLLDRRCWDWSRLLRCAPDVLGSDLPACARDLSRPLTVRLFMHRYQSGEVVRRERHAFVLDGGRWFERHVGEADIEQIVGYFQVLDRQQDLWVDAHLAADLWPGEVEGMTSEAAAEIMWRFQPIRQRLRAVERDAK